MDMNTNIPQLKSISSQHSQGGENELRRINLLTAGLAPGRPCKNRHSPLIKDFRRPPRGRGERNSDQHIQKPSEIVQSET
jgi:hypothetical protein